jgi:cysteine desulfurase
MDSPVRPAAAAAIYLDHAAATPLDPEVAEAMREAAAAFANPSSPHAAGRAAKRTLEAARERILELVGGRTGGTERDRLVFTSGATEANRLAILGRAANRGTTDPRAGWIGWTDRDHASIRAAATELAGTGWRVFHGPVSATGQLDLGAFAAALHCDQRLTAASAGAGGSRILCLTSVCGQTGIGEDLKAIAAAVGDSPDLVMHVDATQAAGWEDLDFAASPAATLALAPHKFGGPRGIGGLVVRAQAGLAALVPGPQELGLRGGTEPVTLAVGFARALERAAADRHAEAIRVTALRERLEAGVVAAAERAGIEAVVVGDRGPRAPHVTLITLASWDRQVVALAADMAGVCLATGTACASGSTEPVAMLPAIGLEPRFHAGSIRLSLGRTTTSDEIEAAITRLGDVFSRLARCRTAGSMSID